MHRVHAFPSDWVMTPRIRGVSCFKWGPYISGALKKRKKKKSHDSLLPKLVSYTFLGLLCQQFETGEDCKPPQSRMYREGALKANEAKWITVVLSKKDNGPSKYPMMASDNANTSSCGESAGEGKSSDSAHGQPRTFGRVKMRNRIEVVWEENML